MSHVRVGTSIEITYRSPNEMVEEMVDSLGSEELFVQTDQELPAGTERSVRIHIPWLGRHLDLHGRVIRSEQRETIRGLRLRLLDGDHDTLEQLNEFITRFRSGAILEETAGPGVPIEQRIHRMNPSLKIMLASKANNEERIVLARDSDPRVIEHLLKNPSITLEEVRRLASRLSMHQVHFSLIMRNGTWMSDESLRAILARNPRLPEFLATSVLQTLPTPTLQTLIKSMNTTASTKRVAGKILMDRGVAVGHQVGRR